MKTPDMELPKAHFTDTRLLNPANPITVNLIGAGGTGSKVLTALMEMNHSLMALNHPGLSVRLWDDDIIADANIGRQRFAASEKGLPKSVALINRINRWAGTNWKAETVKFAKDGLGRLPDNAAATLFISSVDTTPARFEIADILNQMKWPSHYLHNSPRYWLDFGNSQYTGQVILSTVDDIKQPPSEKYETVSNLPFITTEFKDLLQQSEQTDNTPSCSMAEALDKQDLFINATLAQMGSSLLWSLLRNGMTL